MYLFVDLQYDQYTTEQKWSQGTIAKDRDGFNLALLIAIFSVNRIDSCKW